MATPDDTTPSPPADPPPGGSGAGRRSLRRRLTGLWRGLDGGGKGAVLAALIGLPASVAVAVAAVLALNGSGTGDNGREDRDHGPTAGVSSPAGSPDDAAGPGTPTSSSSAAPAPTASLSAASNDIQYTGSVRIAESGPELDSVPPEMVRHDADVRLGLVSPPRLFTDIGDPPYLALWSGSDMPNRQQCSELVSTQGVPNVTVKKGAVVCVRTDAGRIAVLTVTSTSNSFNTGVMAQASVWSEVSDQN